MARGSGFAEVGGGARFRGGHGTDVSVTPHATCHMEPHATLLACLQVSSAVRQLLPSHLPALAPPPPHRSRLHSDRQCLFVFERFPCPALHPSPAHTLPCCALGRLSGVEGPKPCPHPALLCPRPPVRCGCLAPKPCPHPALLCPRPPVRCGGPAWPVRGQGGVRGCGPLADDHHHPAPLVHPGPGHRG